MTELFQRKIGWIEALTSHHEKAKGILLESLEMELPQEWEEEGWHIHSNVGKQFFGRPDTRMGTYLRRAVDNPDKYPFLLQFAIIESEEGYRQLSPSEIEPRKNYNLIAVGVSHSVGEEVVYSLVLMSAGQDLLIERLRQAA